MQAAALTSPGPAFSRACATASSSGRRYAGYQDFTDSVKLHHSLPWLHHSGGVGCEPVDLPANKRHLDMI